MYEDIVSQSLKHYNVKKKVLKNILKHKFCVFLHVKKCSTHNGKHDTSK